jgi:hypothetical protein
MKKMQRPETLRQFYNLMFETATIRAGFVNAYLEHDTPGQKGVSKTVEGKLAALAAALECLRGIPRENDRYRLRLGTEGAVELDLSYEITELEKDLYFFSHTEEEFAAYLEELHPGLTRQVGEGLRFLKGNGFRVFVTDRDGTVNNYCGRYRSSIQSAYNAVFLTRFALRAVEHAVILTSAPLAGDGLIDISVTPPGAFIYAGSKGREFLRENGTVSRYTIEREKQQMLDRLNERLSNLVKRPEYESFALIGSGLQFKFGQSTIARQDISGSIPVKESEIFLGTVRSMVEELDPQTRHFRIEDTGKDIEIILTVQSEEGGLKDFDKGDGVSFLNGELGLHMERGPNLICGDTGSDIPMVTASVGRTKETWTIFVTDDEELRAAVRDACPNALFLSEPDMLVSLLNACAMKDDAYV